MTNLLLALCHSNNFIINAFSAESEKSLAYMLCGIANVLFINRTR